MNQTEQVTQLTREQVEHLQRILNTQNKAVDMLRSIKNTSDLNYSHLNDHSIKLSSNLIAQITQILQEIDGLKS